MKEIQANAVEVLTEIVKKRNWHKGLIERRLASYYKKSCMNGKMSYEVATRVLTILSYKKITDEAWILNYR